MSLEPQATRRIIVFLVNGDRIELVEWEYVHRTGEPLAVVGRSPSGYAHMINWRHVVDIAQEPAE